MDLSLTLYEIVDKMPLCKAMTLKKTPCKARAVINGICIKHQQMLDNYNWSDIEGTWSRRRTKMKMDNADEKQPTAHGVVPLLQRYDVSSQADRTVPRV